MTLAKTEENSYFYYPVDLMLKSLSVGLTFIPIFLILISIIHYPRFLILIDMLAIKLQRRGKKHQPSYRLVVQEKHSKLNGDFIDDLGSYDPRSKIAQIKGDRVKHWIGVGAKATPTVNNLLVTKGIITGEKVSINKPAFKEKVVEVVKPETLKEIKAEVVEVAEEVEVARDEKPEIIAEKEVEVTEALKEEPKKEE